MTYTESRFWCRWVMSLRLGGTYGHSGCRTYGHSGCSCIKQCACSSQKLNSRHPVNMQVFRFSQHCNCRFLCDTMLRSGNGYQCCKGWWGLHLLGEIPRLPGSEYDALRVLWKAGKFPKTLSFSKTSITNNTTARNSLHGQQLNTSSP
jgi:hypothetical protein